ncbi:MULTISPECIES: PTS sugar transporter subunit IIA [Kitasatospora]|uniref:PTS glucose transporter subunit IIA n=1 Tax=Kitasatospora acidiphila TaxID=2567942 RepID=A0A540WDQ6_9ACTN|nr:MULTISPECIES: PTS glucose transporter subunit IIA [Kitasatospora]MDH6143930.1 PTS system glucose-specific IIA component [Kitasatospora sp. GP30]TQF06534.1 PTS glucose transporter subunit IIA [Kitasatospora acidiphila]
MTTVTSPLTGRAVGLANVPDPVFSGAMVGPGTAIDPVREPTTAVAPVDGLVVSMHPHAFVVMDADGRGVLTHLGIDTVQLNGEGFELLVSKGDQVKRGQPVVRWNPAEVEAKGKSPISPIVALEASAEALSAVAETGEVASGGELFTWN